MTADYSTAYADFLARKAQLSGLYGFAPTFQPSWLYDFQAELVAWATRKGRAAMFADCGMGKTPMQLAWAQNVVAYTNRSVLILTPLSVSAQTMQEAAKFDVACIRSRDGLVPPQATIVITNYERLHAFDASAFAGLVCDESSILKHIEGATKAAVTEFARRLPYR